MRKGVVRVRKREIKMRRVWRTVRKRKVSIKRTRKIKRRTRRANMESQARMLKKREK